MAINVLIIVLSFAMLAYWLRRTCLLLLKDRDASDETALPLFSFPRIRTQLCSSSYDGGAFQALNRDYAVLRYLIGKTRLSGVESRLLLWDYRLMCCWYALTRAVSPRNGRLALAEMADVLGVLAAILRAERVQALPR